MPSAPAHADSVWPAFGLACFLASLLQIRHASLALYTAFSLPKILVTLRNALPAIKRSALILAGIQLTASSNFAAARPKYR